MTDEQKLYELLKDFDPAVGVFLSNLSPINLFPITIKC